MNSDEKNFLNGTFFTGVGCGICIGLSFFIYKRFSFRTKALAIKKFITSEDYKVVLVVRTDLQMSKGKIASQCGHAAVGVYEQALKHDPEALDIWLTMGQTKIALKAESLDEIVKLDKLARGLGLITCAVQDAGRTQVAPSTITVLGIGPASKELINKVTGHLKLL